MRKIACLFQRDFHGPKSATIRPDVTPGCEWVLAGEGVATYKWDGTSCLVRDGRLFKRYDAKHGKTPPQGWEACGEPDDVTGHNPGWLPVGDEPDSKWHRAAWEMLAHKPLADGTWELIGPKFSANPHGYGRHTFRRHGDVVLQAPRTFDGLRVYLETFEGEGLVFHHPDGRMAKIRRKDFGFAWPAKGAR